MFLLASVETRESHGAQPHMKVFIACTSFAPGYGGPAVSVSRLAAAVAGTGAKVALWAPDGSAATSSVVPRAAASMTRLGGSLEEALSTAGTPNVIHDNGLWLPHHHCIATLASRRGIARIVSVRGMLEPWAIRHKRLKKAIAWRLYQRRDLERATMLHATAVSEIEAIRALGVNSTIVEIPNGADLPEQSREPVRSAAPASRRQALFLSRIHPKKGLPMLIEAWARLRPAGWSLRVAGPDKCGHRAQVEDLVARRDLNGVVTFLGPVEGEEKAATYRAADLFVLPTHSENFGLVVAEALAYGLPVLTTRGAPWRELETERCGWWVEPTVDGVLAGLSAAIATDPEGRVEMGQRGRALIAARYAWESIAQRFIVVYEQAAAERTG